MGFALVANRPPSSRSVAVDAVDIVGQMDWHFPRFPHNYAEISILPFAAQTVGTHRLYAASV
jgi:hypothetical protein